MREFCVRTVVIGTMLAALAVGGCEGKKPKKSAPEPAAPAAAAMPAELDGVTAAPETKSLERMYYLARVVDVWAKGQEPSVTLSYSGGSVRYKGHSIRMPASEWKGILEQVAASPGGKQSARAGPVDFADGLGPAARFAYFVERTERGELVYTVAKPLEGESTG
jgi:hypothetical protein